MATTPVMRHEHTTTSLRPDETTTVSIPTEKIVEESICILPHQSKGCSKFGRQYQRSTSVRSPFIVPQPKRPRVESNIDTFEHDSTEIYIDPLKGMDDPQLLIELNQWMSGVIHVSRPMNFEPSFYKILLGQEENGWLADEVRK